MSPIPATRPRASVVRSRAENRTGWGFVAPFAVAFLVAIVAPIAYAVYLSLYRQDFFGNQTFVGLSNYVRAFGDPSLWGGLGRIVTYIVIQVPTMMALALVAALAIDSGRLRGWRFFRLTLFLPYAVPGVVAVIIWGFVYGPRFGLVGSVNSLLGTTLDPLSPHWIIVAISVIATWEWAGYNMLVYYSALRTVPTELYEAAAIDGAGAMRTMFSVKLPALRGAIVITLIFSIIGSVQLFNEPNLLKPIAPNAITSDFTPTLYAYTLSFAGRQYSYAATVAIVMGVVTAVIAYIVQLRGHREAMR